MRTEEEFSILKCSGRCWGIFWGYCSVFRLTCNQFAERQGWRTYQLLCVLKKKKRWEHTSSVHREQRGTRLTFLIAGDNSERWQMRRKFLINLAKPLPFVRVSDSCCILSYINQISQLVSYSSLKWLFSLLYETLLQGLLYSKS